VYPPEEAGHYYGYIIETAGQNYTEQSEYSACQSESLLRKVGICSAPSWCRLSATESKGEAVTLSWGAGQSGVGNALVGYEVWVAPYDPDGDYPGDELWEYIGETGTNVRTMQVYPPDTPNTYYLFSVLSVGENYYSGDEWRDSENLLRRVHESFGPWTDTALIQNETKIKAIHITEMQERVNTLLSFYGKSAASFTPVVSGQTSLAGWTQHIMQIRNAIDSIDSTHDAWISIPENKPTVAVMNQIRNIISSL